MSDPLDSLTPRKRKYVSGLAKGKTKKRAALDAGYSESVAESAKSHIETEDVRKAFSALLRKNIPAEKIIQRIAEGIDAMETKFFQKDGCVVETRDVVAFGERRAYAELAAEYGEYFQSKKPLEAEIGGSLKIIVEHLGKRPVTTKAG